MVTDQFTFFDRPEPARATASAPSAVSASLGREPTAGFVRGSETSKAAAEAVDVHAGLMRNQVLAFIRARGDEGATDQEVSLALDMDSDTARARRCELRDSGLVRDNGRRRPTASGRRAVAWVASGQGTEVKTAERRQARHAPPATSSPIPSAPPASSAVIPSPAPCPRCGSRELVEVEIHGGQSTRIDCRECHRFVRFGRWYGRPG
jgi:hypothetical protein